MRPELAEIARKILTTRKDSLSSSLWRKKEDQSIVIQPTRVVLDLW